MTPKKLIVLDYRNGRVVVMDNHKEDDCDGCVDVWAQQNNTSADDCYWMAWDGEIEHAER